MLGTIVGWVSFQSTPSARRATSSSCPRARPSRNFNPRPPRGGRPAHSLCKVHAVAISIHALREEGDQQTKREAMDSKISIHALREEGDVSIHSAVPNPAIFQSTPSARRATQKAMDSTKNKMISIHALREEGDKMLDEIFPAESYFNPRPPRGGRPGSPLQRAAHRRFQSTPSARRATPGAIASTKWALHFNPRPPRGGRQQKRRKNPPRLFHYTHLCTI